MNLNQLKPILYERIKSYWSDAKVVWGSTKGVKPLSPLVVLKLGTVMRSSQPIVQSIGGVVYYAYPTEVPLQIDLFTQGKEVDAEGEIYYENTAVPDLLEFANFIDSISTIEWSHKKDVSLSMLNGVQDLSEIVNDSQWQYRAMLELQVSFTQWIAEHYGVLGEDCIIFGDNGKPIGIDDSKWKKTSSGGGSEDFAATKTGSFDEVAAKIDFNQEERE